MYEQTLWQDHVTEFEDRYTESRNDDAEYAVVATQEDFDRF